MALPFCAALDIEYTGHHVMSMGIACVYDDGMKHVCKQHLLKMYPCKLPTVHGKPVAMAVPYLDDRGLAILNKDGSPKMTGCRTQAWNEMTCTNDLGATVLADGVDPGDFDERCLLEFWVKQPDALIANYEWQQPKDTMDHHNFVQLNKLRCIVNAWADQAREMDTSLQLWGDNLAFDYGIVDRMLEHYNLKTLNYLPMTDSDNVNIYQSYKPLQVLWRMTDVGFLADPPRVIEGTKHNHKASDDALYQATIAASYAHAYLETHPRLM